jgi:nucleotide-binding universal stress UspA family protein
VPTPFTEIVVPLDGSSTAERALGPAAALATRVAVPLRVLSRALPGEEEELSGYLADVTDRYAAVTDVEPVVVVRESIPDAILDGLAPGALVCMSTHGRGGIARAAMGSVAEALVRSIGSPILVVGPEVGDGAPLSGPVVACLDGSAPADRTVEPAQAWSTALDQPLWLVSVVTPSAAEAAAGDPDVVSSGHLASVASRVGGVETWDVLHGDDPAAALAGLARDSKVAVLVMATHGRTGWDRLRLGSVTSSTIRNSPAPVLVVPAAP